MKNLKVFQTINDKSRVSSIDIFRAVAIISVVLFHFDERLPFGFLGVDLFFVISGLLIGGLLTKEFKNKGKISFFRFFLSRGFKIWPSYYFFILFGSLVAFCFYRTSNPGQIIPFWDIKRYLFFYQNYTGVPFHWSFDHVWSLCVEEHFYVLLPIMFLIVQNFFPEKVRLKALFIFVILTIISGMLFKYLSFIFTHSKDTYSGTHNRIDSLAWGVLLNFILMYYREKMKNKKFAFFAFFSGLVILIVSIYIDSNPKNFLFDKIYFHSVTPISFFLMLAGLYFVDFSRMKFLRVIAYYSYNWYLWHPVFVIFITQKLGNTTFGLLAYLMITFVVAVAATMLIEEMALKKRKTVLNKIFKQVQMKKDK